MGVRALPIVFVGAVYGASLRLVLICGAVQAVGGYILAIVLAVRSNWFEKRETMEIPYW